MALQPRLATVLALDIGNTSVNVGAVRGEQIYVQRKVAVARLEELAEVLREMWDAIEKPRRVAACSVNPAALEKIQAVVEEAIGEPIAVVGQDLPLPLVTDLEEPGKIGMDRMCCAAAAFGRLQQACVIVDVGTAVTIDCVNDEGVFLGGAILPGLAMQAAALHQGTEQLPEVKLREPDWVFGANTEQAIVGGIVYGLRGAIRERVEAYASELSRWPLVICTGGDAALVKMDEGFVQATVPGLCLLGVARAFYQSLGPEEDAGETEDAEE